MCPTLTVGSFFRRVRSTFLKFVQQLQTSTTLNLNNSNLKSASKTKSKNKTDVQNLEITLRIPHSPTFFGAMQLFLKLFGLHQRVPLHLFRHFATQWMSKKSQRVPPFTFFGTVTQFKNLILNFFLGNFFQVSKGLPFTFFHILQPAGVSQTPKGPPFYNFEP